MNHLPTAAYDRRAFLRRVSGLGAGWLATTLLPAAARPTVPNADPNRIGVQLYTLRDQMQAGFESTIEKVAQIGYKEVEFAGYFERTPEQVRQLLDRLGLRAPSTHIGLEALRNNLDAQLQTALTIGHTYITIPAIMGAFTGQLTADDWHRYAEEFNQIGKACQDRGLHLAYHNHHFEFVPAGPDQTGLDVLVSETDPALVSFEMDLMWTVLAEQDPLALFAKYPGRFVMWHVKDLKEIAAARAASKQGGMAGFRGVLDRLAAVGEGEIDFPRIFAQAEQSGLKHFFVENDAPKDGLANVQTNFGNLSQMLTSR